MLNLLLNLRRSEFSIKVHMNIPSNSIYCLYGPSAAGKSSILSVIAGFETGYDAVQLKVDEQVLAATSETGVKPVFVPPWRRGIAYLNQNASLFPHLTVSDNVSYGIHQKWSEQSELDSTTHTPRQWREELVERLEIQPYLKQKPSQLSGGLTQRVALARALVTRPRILLLDEPFSALDWRARRYLQNLVIDYQQRLNMMVILVTHQLEEAQHMAHQIGLLDRGVLLQEGSPDHLLCAPETARVAALLGYMGQVAVNGRAYALHPQRAEVTPIASRETSLVNQLHQHPETNSTLTASADEETDRITGVPSRPDFGQALSVRLHEPLGSAVTGTVQGGGGTADLTFSATVESVYLQGGRYVARLTLEGDIDIDTNADVDTDSSVDGELDTGAGAERPVFERQKLIEVVLGPGQVLSPRQRVAVRFADAPRMLH